MPPHRRGHPPRLVGWDYANAGAYFITVTVHGRLPVLREPGGGPLSTAGAIVENRWRSIPDRFVTARADAFVVMPDHMHGILWLGMELGRSEGALMNQGPTLPGRAAFPAMTDPRVTLGKVVRAWKAECTRAIRRTMPEFRWQSRYDETVIRTDRALREMRRYVRDNPLGAYVLRAAPPASRTTA